MIHFRSNRYLDLPDISAVPHEDRPPTVEASWGDISLTISPDDALTFAIDLARAAMDAKELADRWPDVRAFQERKQ